ncbi:hypothetical protein EW146_g4534 [Bondarzewia mesenterica]|uniref:Uncharacterized protein n=1 Tax=Bondarzewia mesenterica TaxID=1095465 RepID=A0A4S4LU87_9AGAM|nr:hypothetical protein EW146_g4534 [Bondarzewia mesenterica]
MHIILTILNAENEIVEAGVAEESVAVARLPSRKWSPYWFSVGNHQGKAIFVLHEQDLSLLDFFLSVAGIFCAMLHAMLPQSLWLLISSLALFPPFVFAQNNTRIALGTPLAVSGSVLASANPQLFVLPDASFGKQLSISVALCTNSSAPPRFFVTNSSDVSTPGPDNGQDVWELTLGTEGFGNLTLGGGAGGKIAIWGGTKK